MFRFRIPFLSLALAAALLTAPPFAAQEPAPDDARVIEVTAKRYEFAPGEIRVKKGEKVRLKVRALDRTPGLRFAEDQRNWRLEKDQERVIEFVAARAGTYSFKCSVFCGLRHGRMRGRLIVEE
jgi:cytochrome c oxidase subunit 2